MTDRCPTHKKRLKLRSPGTPEQKWCGTWYECPHPNCYNSVLAPSKALRDSLADAKKRAREAR